MAVLTWQQAAVLTVVVGALGVVLVLVRHRWTRRLAPFAFEVALISGLYSVWQLAGTLSVMGTQDAFRRAHWIWRTERTLHLPSELHVQHVVTADPFVARAANLYYMSMHFTVLFVFLFWLFLRHRDRYRPVRRVLALTTLVCLLIQLVPVAPPRLLPDLGFADTAKQYGQSVYGLGFGADELSAMPSVHVAWAVLVGVAVWRIGRGPGRVIGPLHTVITVVVVVATANHFWADGIVAVVALVACFLLERGARTLVTAGLARWRARRAPVAPTPEPTPETTPDPVG